MNFQHYLPNTEKRIETLRKIIRGRTVAIITPGYSLYEFDRRIEEFAGLNLCFAGINRCMPLEQDILSRIKKQFSLYMCSAAPDFFIEDIASFLDRSVPNIFISERLNFKADGGGNLLRLYENYDDKLLFFTSVDSLDEKPSKEYPLHFVAQNSLSILICLSLIGEPKSVILFGADGGRISKEDIYYKGLNDFTHPDRCSPDRSLSRDTGLFNYSMKDYIAKLRRLYQLKKCDILNCSEHSHLDTFPKITYDKVIEYLRRVG